MSAISLYERQPVKVINVNRLKIKSEIKNNLILYTKNKLYIIKVVHILGFRLYDQVIIIKLHRK